MKHNILDGFRRAVEAESLGVYSIHLHVDSYKPVSHHFRVDARTHLFSGSKAFTSIAVGIAEAEGILSLDDSVLYFFPEYSKIAVPGSEDITIRHLLHMCAGHDRSLFSTDEQTHNTTTDWAQLFFQQAMHWPAGTHFLYDNGSTYMLSRVVEKASGQTLRDYLVPRLFTPLGIQNPQWHTCPLGHSLGAFGLFLKTEEFARLGILLLHNGIWNGVSLVPAEYLRQAAGDIVETNGFEDTENNCGYGYQLWRCSIPHAFRADGKFGQYSIVLPKQHSVVSVTAHNEGCANQILRTIWREVLPLIS